MAQNTRSECVQWLSAWKQRAAQWFRRQMIWSLVVALVFSLAPWTSPVLTPATHRALQGMPSSVQWAAPLALSISRGVDQLLAAVGTAAVHAGESITLTLSKRDDGANLSPWVPVGPDPLTPGDSLVYYLQITNTGSVVATVHLTETLPEGLTCSDARRILGHDGGADWWLGSCSGREVYLYTLDAVSELIFDGLAPGAAAALYVRADVPWPVEDGHVFVNDRAGYYAVAAQEATYVYTGTSTVSTTVHSPRLAISKAVAPQQVEGGEEITFTLAVSNSGHYTLTAPFTLTVVDQLPPEIQNVRQTAFPGALLPDIGTSAITWTLPFTPGGRATLAPGEVLTATAVARVEVPITHTQRITNAAYGVTIVPTDQVTPASATGPAVSVEVLSHPALTVTKTSVPDALYASQDWVYWVTVTNDASAQGNAIGLVITDIVPAETVLESVSEGPVATEAHDCATAGCAITWTFPAAYSLFWGESTAVSFTVGPVSSIVVSGTVITNADYGVRADNALATVTGEPVTTTLWGAPHLAAVKTATPAGITARHDAGDVITFTMTVTNLGDATADATSVTITDVVPAHTELIQAGFSSGTGTVDSPSISAGSAITWHVDGSLAPAQSAAVTFTVHVSTPVDNNTEITNQAFVTCGEGDAAPTNAVGVVVYSEPTLAIAKAVSSGWITPGEQLTYTVYYTNLGTMNAYNTVLTDVLPNPAHASFVEATPPATPAGGAVIWSLGAIVGDAGPLAAGRVTIVLSVDGSVANGTVLTNSAEIRSDEGGIAETEPVTTMVAGPDVEVSKSVQPGSVRAGGQVTYAITFANVGLVEATDVTIADVLPVSLTLALSETVGAAFAGPGPGNSYAWVSPTVAPGSAGAITITAWVTTTGGWVDPAGTVLMNVVTSSAAMDINPLNDAVQVPATIIPATAGGIGIAISPSTVQVPGPAAITVTVTDLYGNLAWNGDDLEVNLSATPAGASIIAPTQQVVDGQVTTVITSDRVGPYTVTGELLVVGISDATLVTFTAGNEDRFVFAPIGDQAAGISFTVSITAVDAYENVATGLSGPIDIDDVAFPDTLEPQTVTFVDGVASSRWVTITLARVNTPIVAAAGTGQASQSDPFTVTSGAPAVVLLEASAITIPLDVDATVTATVEDAHGNAVPEDALAYGISLGSVHPSVGTTDGNGEATFAISSTTTGAATVVVTASSGVTGWLPVAFIGFPANITVTIVPSYVVVGGLALISIEVTDARGDPVDWDSVTVETSQPLGLGSIVPSTEIPLDSNGRATAVIASTHASAKTVVVTAASNQVTGTGVVTFTAAPAYYVEVVMVPRPQDVGAEATLYVNVTDQYDNPLQGEVITFTIPAGVLGSGGISPNPATTNGLGDAQATISSTVAGSAQLTVTVGSDPAVSTTALISFRAGQPDQITVTVSPTEVGGGVNATLTATVTDRYGNACEGDTVSWETAPGALGGGGIVPSAAQADADGVATALISGTISGMVTITGSAAYDVQDTAMLTIASGPLNHLETSYVADQVAGGDFTLTITAVDAGGTQRDSSGDVLIADASGTARPVSVTMSGGVATVVLSITQALVDDWITVTWADDSLVGGTTNPFTVTAGAPAVVTLAATPGAIGPGGETSTLVATVVDAYGNPAADRPVTFAAVSGPAVTLAPTLGTTDAGGQVTVTLTSGTDLGTVTVEATCEGESGFVDVSVRRFYVYLPVVFRGYSSTDLRVAGVKVLPGGGDEYEIEVTIENSGSSLISADFWVDLYIDPSGPIAVNVLWNDVCDYGKAWYVRQDLGPGQQLVLSTTDPDDPANPGDRYSDWPGRFSGPGLHELRAMVDSYGAESVGTIIENNEGNNLSTPLMYDVPASASQYSGPMLPVELRPTPAP